MALAQVEEAYKHEKETKQALEHLFSLCTLPNLQDALDAAQDESSENRLLPAMNKIWPLLVACVRNRNPVVSFFFFFFKFFLGSFSFLE